MRLSFDFFKDSTFLYLCLFYLLLCLGVGPYAHGDLDTFRGWAMELKKGGLQHVYCDKVTDYTPLFIYFLKVFNYFFSTEKEYWELFYWLKVIPLMFSWGIATLLYTTLKLQQRPPDKVWIYALNIGLLYNSFIWAQVDDIHSFFLLGCVVLLYYRQPAWAVVAFIFALNMKLQAIVFLPVLGLWWLASVDFSWKKIGTSLLGAFVSQFILLIPVFYAGCFSCLVDKVLMTAVGRYPFVTANAYNLWYLLEPKNLIEMMTDELPFWAGKSYHFWGQIFFILSLLAIVLPMVGFMLKRAFRPSTVVNRPLLLNLETGLIACTMIGLFFFYFPTQMHERYSHPAIVMCGAWAVLGTHRLRYWIFGILSFAYVMNLERVMRFKRLMNYDVFIIHPVTIALLYGAVVVALLVIWYREWYSHSEPQ